MAITFSATPTVKEGEFITFTLNRTGEDVNKRQQFQINPIAPVDKFPGADGSDYEMGASYYFPRDDVNFDVGETTKTLRTRVKIDAFNEGTEYASFRLYNQYSNVQVINPVANVTLSDTPPTAIQLTYLDPMVMVTEGQDIVIRMQLNSGNHKGFWWNPNFQTYGSSQILQSDLELADTRIIPGHYFAPGENYGEIRLRTVQDGFRETDEGLELTEFGMVSRHIEDPNVNVFTTNTTKIILRDADSMPTISITGDNNSVNYVSNQIYNYGSGTVNAVLATAQAVAPTPTPVEPATPAISPEKAAAISGMTASDWEMYVDRYPLTLGTIYENDVKPSTGQSKAAFGESHYINYGFNEGRILKVASTSDDLTDYGAYVENYGTTLLDVYRSGVGTTNEDGSKKTLFEWGKWHYQEFGKAEGREIAGGVDWGAIVRNDSALLSQYEDAKRANPELTAFEFGFNNQSTIRSTTGVSVGSGNFDDLTGQRVFGLNGNDTVRGTIGNDILHGGFGNDTIIGGGGLDQTYGGPGSDIFVLNSGGTLNIRDFRQGADVVQLGDVTKEQLSLQELFIGNATSTLFVDNQTGNTLATIYGQRPSDFTFANSSNGIANVYI